MNIPVMGVPLSPLCQNGEGSLIHIQNASQQSQPTGLKSGLNGNQEVCSNQFLFWVHRPGSEREFHLFVLDIDEPVSFDQRLKIGDDFETLT